MKLGRSLNVIRAGIAWRSFGSDAAGAALIDAVSGNDEQVRTLAAMSLVKAGERSVGLIEQAYSEGRATPLMMRMLADIGGRPARDLLCEIAAHNGPVAEAAADSLALLDRIDRLDNTG